MLSTDQDTGYKNVFKKKTSQPQESEYNLKVTILVCKQKLTTNKFSKSGSKHKLVNSGIT